MILKLIESLTAAMCNNGPRLYSELAQVTMSPENYDNLISELSTKEVNDISDHNNLYIFSSLGQIHVRFNKHYSNKMFSFKIATNTPILGICYFNEDYQIHCTDGPAIVVSWLEIYALDGKIMSREEYNVMTDPLAKELF